MEPLYKIAAEISDLLLVAREHAEDHDGEIPDWLSDRMDAAEVDKGSKIESIACQIKNELAMADAIKAECAAMAHRERAARNRAKWLKTYLAACIPGEKHVFPSAAIGWRGSSSVEITCADMLKPEFLRHIPATAEPDKKAIKAAIKSGQVVDGAVMVEKQNISIK